MTKVQLQFDITRPLDQRLLEQVGPLHAVYGIARLEVAPALDRLVVEYDATRLNPSQVQAILLNAGLPVLPRAA